MYILEGDISCIAQYYFLRAARSPTFREQAGVAIASVPAQEPAIAKLVVAFEKLDSVAL